MKLSFETSEGIEVTDFNSMRGSELYVAIGEIIQMKLIDTHNDYIMITKVEYD